jgi:hypothetical protein
MGLSCKGLFDYSKKDEVKVKNEGNVFTEEMLENTGFSPGDCFEMIVGEDRIIL